MLEKDVGGMGGEAVILETVALDRAQEENVVFRFKADRDEQYREFLGPLLAIGLMWLTADHFRSVFWIAVLPAFLSVGVLLVAVREPERLDALRKVRMPLSRNELRRLSVAYWRIVAVAAVFTLARF